MAVRWYLAYALSYRNIEEQIKDWNIELDHPSVQCWIAEYGSWLQTKVRKYLSRNFKRSWRLDELYIKIKGEWGSTAYPGQPGNEIIKFIAPQE